MVAHGNLLPRPLANLRTAFTAFWHDLTRDAAANTDPNCTICAVQARPGAPRTRCWDDARVTNSETLIRRGNKWFRFEPPNKRLFKELQKTLAQ